MAKYSDVIEGMTILAGLDDSPHGVCAEHDQIWAGPDYEHEDDIGPDVRDRLTALGWAFDGPRTEDPDMDGAMRWTVYV